jgi:hypothetical protein
MPNAHCWLTHPRHLVGQVCVMVWDELTSTDSALMQGMMGTHDQECQKYFKETKVCRDPYPDPAR